MRLNNTLSNIVREVAKAEGQPVGAILRKAVINFLLQYFMNGKGLLNHDKYRIVPIDENGDITRSNCITLDGGSFPLELKAKHS